MENGEKKANTKNDENIRKLSHITNSSIRCATAEESTSHERGEELS